MLAKLVLLGGVAIGASSGAAFAQGEQSRDIYYGRMKATPTCPALTWQLRGKPGAVGDRVGYFVYENGQGASKAVGTENADGTFHLTLTSLAGSGPVGTVEGKRGKDGTIAAMVNVNGCPPIVIQPIKPSNGSGAQHEGS
jgi:hypothetical protein